MEEFIPYIPTGLVLIGLIAINVKLGSRPTFDKARELFMDKGICEERSGNLEKKLDEISKDVKAILKRNGG